jgi:hypothetical protein
LREEYRDQADVLAFVEQVERDLPEHLHDFWTPAEAVQAAQAGGGPTTGILPPQERLARYAVNVLMMPGVSITGAPGPATQITG